MRPLQILTDVFHFAKALNDTEQNLLLRNYLEHKDHLYVPRLKSGHSMNLQMVSLGKHWSAVDYQYHESRVDHDQVPVKSHPDILNIIAQRRSKECFPYHSAEWDICIMNYYDGTSTLGYHQDNSESKEALKIGHPVVSFSIGASCIFRIGCNFRNGPYKDIQLDHGDVLVFGGSARMAYHGVMKILPTDDSTAFLKELNGGRVNFTLRRF